jgi:hypothetical protein
VRSVLVDRRQGLDVGPTRLRQPPTIRAQAIAQGAGTGRDIAVGLLVGNATNLVQSWAAFNVDDAAAVYDVDAKGR